MRQAQELVKKKSEGINIRIIVSREDSNKAMINKLKEVNVDVKVIDRWGYNEYNSMHDKFCIVDMDYFMHGSYNWTQTANHNDETWSTAVDHELVHKFVDKFMELYME